MSGSIQFPCDITIYSDEVEMASGNGSNGTSNLLVVTSYLVEEPEISLVPQIPLSILVIV